MATELKQEALAPDAELKARHRAMWASGNYPSMVETFLLPLGPRLVEACGIGPGMHVLDVAAGTGNASIPAAQRGARVTASDLTPELLEAGRHRAEGAGIELEWIEADAERLPFEDASFDAVISLDRRDVRARSTSASPTSSCASAARGGTLGLLSWTPEGMIGALFRDDGPVRPAAARRGAAAAALGQRGPPSASCSATASTCARSTAARSRSPRSSTRATTASSSRPATGRRSASAPTPRNGPRGEFDAALDDFCDEWNRGTEEEARFEMEYLLAVGTRA